MCVCKQGDVERTGYYDKLTNRRAIMVVLKHLWTLPTHRAAFRSGRPYHSSSVYTYHMTYILCSEESPRYMRQLILLWMKN